MTPAEILISCVTSGKLRNFYGSQFSHLQNGNYDRPALGGGKIKCDNGGDITPTVDTNALYHLKILIVLPFYNWNAPFARES